MFYHCQDLIKQNDWDIVAGIISDITKWDQSTMTDGDVRSATLYYCGSDTWNILSQNLGLNEPSPTSTLYPTSTPYPTSTSTLYPTSTPYPTHTPRVVLRTATPTYGDPIQQGSVSQSYNSTFAYLAMLIAAIVFLVYVKRKFGDSPIDTVKKESVVDSYEPSTFIPKIPIFEVYDEEDDPFEPNNSLPKYMNIEGEELDRLIEPIGFYVDMSISAVTNDFYLYAINDFDDDAYDEVEEASLDKLQRTTPDISRKLAKLRLQAGVDPKLTMTVTNSGLIFIEVSRPIRKSTPYTPNKLGSNVIRFGQYHDGPIVKPVGINLEDPDYWSGLIVGGSGSGKTNQFHISMIDLLFNTSPDDLDVYLLDTEKVGMFVYGDCPHVKAQVRTQAGALEMMKDLYEHFQLVKSGERPVKQVLLVIDEVPQLLALANQDEEKRARGLEFIERLQAFASVFREYGFNLILITQYVRAKFIPGELLANVKWQLVGESADTKEVMKRFNVSDRVKSLRGKGDFIFNSKNEMRYRADFLDCGRKANAHIPHIASVVDKWGKDSNLIDYDNHHTVIDQNIIHVEDKIETIDDSKIKSNLFENELREEFGKKIFKAANKVIKADIVDECFDVENNEWRDEGKKLICNVGWGSFKRNTFYYDKAEQIIACALRMRTHTKV